MRAGIFSLLFAALAMLSTLTSYSQSPAPVVPPANPAVTSEATAANLKVLRELKAANEETLKKQKATLATLDELQKAADQIKIFAKRT
jgi:hypothetical protein